MVGGRQRPAPRAPICAAPAPAAPTATPCLLCAAAQLSRPGAAVVQVSRVSVHVDSCSTGLHLGCPAGSILCSRSAQQTCVVQVSRHLFMRSLDGGAAFTGWDKMSTHWSIACACKAGKVRRRDCRLLSLCQGHQLWEPALFTCAAPILIADRQRACWCLEAAPVVPDATWRAPPHLCRPARVSRSPYSSCQPIARLNSGCHAWRAL